ncbi:MAG: protein kinase, partial [Planctomycetes bacterium]|nr:protein kinase [Planctomycetota bacterium]
MSQRFVLLPCPCGAVHQVRDPGAATCLRCKKSGVILLYECDGLSHFRLRGSNREHILDAPCVTVGRQGSWQISHPLLSRVHCSFIFQDGRYFLRDEHSCNGTWLNERRLTEPGAMHPLRGGDLIRLADLSFRYLAPARPSQRPHPLAEQDLVDTGLEFPDIKIEDNDKMLGRLLGEYRIVSIISQGGMGRVYQAEREATGQKCVIKTILPDQSARSNISEILQRFLLEMEVSLSLRHPNIIEYYDIGQVGHSLYIAMEYFPGRHLKYWFEHTPATYQQVVNIGAQAAWALGYAHERGVVHRDIKPENILYREDGNVKIIDFGVAKAKQTDLVDSSRITATNAFIGTLRYMSPEQATHAGELTGRC